MLGAENDEAIERLEQELQEIQSEIRMRKWGQDIEAHLQYCPDSTSLGIKVAQSKLSKIFRQVGNTGYGFPARHALFLLKTHPSLIKESFNKRTVVSFFLQARAEFSILKELCILYREQIPWNPTLEVSRRVGWSDPFISNPLPLSAWIYSFDREPNVVADACIYGAPPGVMRMLIEQFPHHLMQGDKGRWEIPAEIILNRSIFRELYPGKPWHGPSPGELQDTLTAMLAYHPNLLMVIDDAKLDSYVRELATGGTNSRLNFLTPGERLFLKNVFDQYKTKLNDVLGGTQFGLKLPENGLLHGLIPDMNSLFSASSIIASSKPMHQPNLNELDTVTTTTCDDNTVEDDDVKGENFYDTICVPALCKPYQRQRQKALLNKRHC